MHTRFRLKSVGRINEQFFYCISKLKSAEDLKTETDFKREPGML